ncbi:MAG: hypothetical protein J6M62_03840 [Selenomonadaceae bacterium]|nr:hypothetical protein [Selenomonadaceae bacterium]MBO6304199.1 hypothetical protein [Selenomonadaceae bacterium]
MKDVNVVIAWSLGIMGFTAVVGWIIISWITGTSSGTEVPISVISGLSGILTGKSMTEAKFRKELEKNKENFADSVKQGAE